MSRLAPFAAVLLAITACQSGPSPSTAADILIASDFPSSDPGFSAQAQLAIQLAIDQQHGRIGQFTLGYVPFNNYLGNTASQAKGIQNVKHMIGDARFLGMIGPWTSNMAYAEIPRANPADLVIVSPSNTSVCITRPNPICGPGQPPWQSLTHPNNYFRIAAPDSFQGRALARYIRTLGVTQAAAFNELGPQGDLVLKDFSDELARAGGKLVFSQPLDSTTRTFKRFLVSAKAAGAQAILAIGSADDGTCAARAQMTGIFPNDVLFLGYDGILADKCIRDAAQNGGGMLVATSDVEPTHSSDAASIQAVADFRKAYPKIQDIQTYVFATYDSARILIEAISRAVKADGGRKPTRAEIVKAVSEANFVGVTGTYSFDSHGDALSPMMSIYRVDNGRWVYQNKFDISGK
jgi:branched-chain amino acid transport system substrate-binding protein